MPKEGVTVIGQYFLQVKQQSIKEHAGMISKGKKTHWHEHWS